MNPTPFVLIDGHVPTPDELVPFALVNDGHFTAMQVRAGQVRGLELHLHRLVAAHDELFASRLDADTVQTAMRRAVDGHPDCYLRVTIAEPTRGRAAIMTVVRPPVEPTQAALSLTPVRWTRAVPHVKHIGTFPQIHLAREAERAGYDDALLVDDAGDIAETTIANVAFLDGTGVVWPTGPALAGITWQLLDVALAADGKPNRRQPVSLDDLGQFAGAVTVNSIGVEPVGRIGEHVFDDSVAAATMLQRRYLAIEPSTI